jgi:hypothetical protein
VLSETITTVADINELNSQCGVLPAAQVQSIAALVQGTPVPLHQLPELQQPELIQQVRRGREGAGHTLWGKQQQHPHEQSDC